MTADQRLHTESRPIKRRPFSPLSRCSVYLPPCREPLRILVRLGQPQAMTKEAISSFSFLPPPSDTEQQACQERNCANRKPHYRVGQVHSANTTVKFRLLLINPFFAQLYSMLLGLLFSFEQLALDSLNLDDRSELVPIVNNTN
jgi:hypothetical protein